VIAAGVWTGGLSEAVSLRPSRGSHLLVPASRLGEPRAAVNVPVPGEHGRWVFALPRSDGLVAIGLTDVPGEPTDEPRPDAAEEAELLDRASAALATPLGPGDVCGRYAGLRPLAAALRSVAAPERLVRRYGTEAPAVAALADGRPELLDLIAPGVPVCGAELLWAARHEFAQTVSDLVDRRVRAGLVPAWRAAVVEAVEALGLDAAPARTPGM
jgi:glycerol-3-phosphate dehydrogenase